MATANQSTVVATLIARGQTPALANAAAEDWGIACAHDWTVVSKWLASTSVALIPQAIAKDNRGRPAGTSRR